MSETYIQGGTAHPRLTRQQKAAAVIVSLGTDKHPSSISTWTRRTWNRLPVAKLGYLDSSATEDVLTEYYQMCMTNKAVTRAAWNTPGLYWKRRLASRRLPAWRR